MLVLVVGVCKIPVLWWWIMVVWCLAWCAQESEPRWGYHRLQIMERRYVQVNTRGKMVHRNSWWEQGRKFFTFPCGTTLLFVGANVGTPIWTLVCEECSHSRRGFVTRETCNMDMVELGELFAFLNTIIITLHIVIIRFYFNYVHIRSCGWCWFMDPYLAWPWLADWWCNDLLANSDWLSGHGIV